MEYRLLPIFTLLNLALVATHAALPPEVYWKSVLLTTPMPKAITDILYHDWVEEKSSSVNAVWPEQTANEIQVTYHYAGTETADDEIQVTYHYAGTESVDDEIQVTYHYAGTETQSHDHNVALFFLEKDLSPGTKLDLHFKRSSNQAKLLPRQVADSIPFSSNNLNDIFEKFSVKPGSKEAEIMKHTISVCEAAKIKGEEKYCATSLESMVDFSTSKLGNNVEAVSTEMDKDKETKLQTYTVAPGLKKLAGGDNVVVCHKLNYPHAVFYCHKIESTIAYSVPLEGANGIRVKAVAVCHADTSEWNPKHLAFHVLKVKPGTVPVCHFLTDNVLVWAPRQIASN